MTSHYDSVRKYIGNTPLRGSKLAFQDIQVAKLRFFLKENGN
jgi:hypothetical protein